MFKMKIRTAFLFLLVLTLVVPIASAQDGNNVIDNIRSQLERTDEIIQQANELVRGTNTPGAAFALEQAVGIQKQAWENFRRGTVDGYTLAAKLTLQARELAKKALAAARLSELGSDAVQNRLERTEELLRRAREEMPAQLDESLRAIFETARRNLSQAWEFYRNGQYRPAVKLAAQVEKTARRLIQITNRQNNLSSGFERRFNAAKEFVSRVEAHVARCNSQAANKLLEQAKSALRMAADLAKEGRYEAAVKHIQQARRLATEAADLCGRPGDLRSTLERLTSEAERVREEIPRGDETAKKLMEQVYSQLENAKQFIANHQNENAAAALRAAQLTLKQLKNYLNSGE